MRNIMKRATTLRRLALWVWFLILPVIAQAQTQLGSAAALRAKYDAVQTQLAKNVFGRPLVLESTEASGQLSGDIFAVLSHPFDQVSASLSQPGVWCDVLMLHLNTKHCAVRGTAAARMLAVSVGRKFDQPLSEAQRVEFTWQPPNVADDYLSVRLSADKGPLSTRDYRIELEATPLGDGKTFIHLGYAYAYGVAARIAMQGYLATLGADKVGFTTSGKDSAGEPAYVGGVRGVVERNTMRYYLAIDAFMDSPKQVAPRLAAWFDSTERYARQLHEVEREDYLAMKRNEYKRLASNVAE
ncbi:hypothetical protein WDL1CHR_04963 [Variovorax sp. WDL1]|nr:NAD/FAD-utilizing enzyme apparently involved in cell division [Variovorax sp. WDL1]PNG46647.1 hypothetical protein CHC06_06990 [Variovorax sp. B2]PNG48702.1 hypothetical protein CHC07_07878 [Variovorax sp. B4]VTV14429.1 hypothetical protein WDL1CHR_04963 [Variovorax sp. WDL1]